MSSATYIEREIVCLDCSRPFPFTAKEQELFHRKGFRKEPRRCQACRSARDARRDAAMPPAPEQNGESS